MNISSVFTFANQISIRTLVQSIMYLVYSKLHLLFHVASNISLEFLKVVLNHILIHAYTDVIVYIWVLTVLTLRRLYVWRDGWSHSRYLAWCICYLGHLVYLTSNFICGISRLINLFIVIFIGYSRFRLIAIFQPIVEIIPELFQKIHIVSFLVLHSTIFISLQGSISKHGGNVSFKLMIM